MVAGMKTSITALICLTAAVSGCSTGHHGDASAFCSHKVEVRPAEGLPAPQSLAELEKQEHAPYWKVQGDASVSDCEKTTESVARSEDLSVGKYIKVQEEAPRVQKEEEKNKERAENEEEEP